MPLGGQIHGRHLGSVTYRRTLLRRHCRRKDSFDRFQIGTIPGNRNMRAAFGKIVEDKPCTAALEQALRDEDPEPHVVRYTRTRRKIGFTKAPQEVKGKPRAVIVDLDRDGLGVPESSDAYLASRELDRILDEVVEPMHDLGAPPDQRLLLRGLAG